MSHPSPAEPDPNDDLVHLNVRVPDTLRRELKAFCALCGVTLAEGIQLGLDAWRAEAAKNQGVRHD
jgi:hypothetical protein